MSKPEKCPLENRMVISGDPLHDLAGIGKGFKVINTPEKDYPSLAYTSMKMIREEYIKIGKPINEAVWSAAIKYFGLQDVESADLNKKP